MSTATRLLTADELWNMPGNGGRNELIRGELHPMSPTNFRHSVIAMRIGSALQQFAVAHGLGLVGPEGGFLLARHPDTLLAPDVAFVRQDRIPAGGAPETFFDGAPDLAVEIVSPNDTWREIDQKISDYLQAGTRLVWIVNPKTKTVTTYQPGPVLKLFQVGHTLTGEDVLPGLQLPVADIFA